MVGLIREYNTDQNFFDNRTVYSDVAASLNNLAVLRYHQNRYDEAEALFLQALEIWESVLGSNHPNTQSTKNSLAHLRTNQGKS